MIAIQKDGLTVFQSTLWKTTSSVIETNDLILVVDPTWLPNEIKDFELPYLFDSAKAYLETLQKSYMILDKYHVEILVPGHGQATESKKEIERRIELAKDYLERLIDAVTRADAEAILGLEKEMTFPSNFTKGCHEENITIIKKEYS